MGRLKTTPSVKTTGMVLCAGLILGFIIYQYVFTMFVVEGGSMEPGIHSSDTIFVDRLMYRLGDIERGDVVVFKYPADTHFIIVKRVIGLPGDTIRIKDGYMFVNDVKQYEFFIEVANRSHETITSMVVPHGHYFVAGDNRRSSFDSRVWSLLEGYPAFVPDGYIVGKPVIRILPFSDFGWIDEERLFAMK